MRAMNAPASAEVRTCDKCQQPAVVLAFEWKHTISGTASGEVTRDYRCQTCGAKYTVHPRSNIIVMYVLGVIFLLAICPGAVFLYLAWSRSQVEKKIPIAVGAPRPVMRFRSGPPARSCGACGGVAVITSITRHKTNGIPTGTDVEYCCGQCKKEFSIESPWGHFVSLLFIATLVLVGAAVGVSFIESWGMIASFAAGGAIVLIALYILAKWGIRLANRVRHPILDTPL
jgi:DNA-directed RNA polymerase subunit RPC12/RpoP